MKTLKVKHLVLLSICLGLASCTTVVVRKNPGDDDKGIRYYRPKPYLFITPSKGGGSEPTFTINQGKALDFQLKQPQAMQQQSKGDVVQVSFEQDKPGDAKCAICDKKHCVCKPQPTPTPPKEAGPKSNVLSITMQVVYLPDFAEEYSIRLTPGLGIGELNIKLDNGWNLTSVGIKTDQQTDEIIKSTSDLISSIGSVSRGGSGERKFLEDGSKTEIDNKVEILATNIPFGFYEAVIATDPCGRKQMFGWRYIGFMPFQAGMFNACEIPQANCCDHQGIYGMVMDPNGILVFQKICDIPNTAMLGGKVLQKPAEEKK